MRTSRKTKHLSDDEQAQGSSCDQTAADTVSVAYERALSLLTRREHSALELHHKLGLRGFGHAVVEAVLQRLVAENWLSDARFAEVYARTRADKGYGPLRIRQALRERGVDESIIDEVLLELEDFWAGKLTQVWRKRFGGALPTAPSSRVKQLRFLRQRGYTIDQINALFREAE